MIIKGYGTTYETGRKQDTIVYKDLLSLNIEEDNIYIDFITDSQKERPMLETLLMECEKGDRIDIYSIENFTQGKCDKVYNCYGYMLQKDINVLIYDFSGACAKISPCSSVRLGITSNGEDFIMPSNKTYEELIFQFAGVCFERDTIKKSLIPRVEISDVFKDIYFAFENYQISIEETMQLLREFCEINEEETFYVIAKSYEGSLRYESDLLSYAEENPEILNKPKRCNKQPEEYFEVLNKMDDTIEDERVCVNKAMEELGFLVGYDVFHRWNLIEDKTISYISNLGTMNNIYAKHTKKDYR